MPLAPRSLFALLILICFSNCCLAQNNKASTPIEVQGSGRIVQEKQMLKSFDTLDLEYLYGFISVEVGDAAQTLDI